MSHELPHILVADDERAIRMMLETGLTFSGFRVSIARSGREAVEAARTNEFDAVVCDIFMPDGDGLLVVRELRAVSPKTPIILVTAQGSMDLTVQALSEGASDFLAKPFEVSVLADLLRRCIAARHEAAKAKNTDASALLDDLSSTGLVGRSPAMVSVYKLIAQASRTEATVLVNGESGTGKELVARAIHHYSSRAAKPFVAVNCSGLTETLLEAELFGHVKGAFTGAANDRAGLFEAADSGTLFLDELATTSPSFQASLLRVLQSGEVRRVGSTSARHVDVRVIGASNVRLREMADAGNFRPDLFYRLSVLSIDLPPLRERGDDLELLTLHFLRRLSGGQEPPLRIAQDAMQALRAHPFPGNVRELENALIHAAALASDRVITIDCLPAHLAGLAARKTGSGSAIPPDLIADWPTMEELQRRYLQLVLSRNEGNRSRTATALGLDRRTVQRMLAKYQLAVPGDDEGDDASEELPA